MTELNNAKQGPQEKREIPPAAAVSQIVAKVSKAVSDLPMITSIAIALSHENTELSNKVKHFEDTTPEGIEALTDKVERYNKQITKLCSEIETLNSVISEQEETLAEKEDALSAHRDHIATLNDQILQLQNEIKDLKQ